MIGIDTNVLVRYIVQDDENQAGLANDLIENQCSEAVPGFISRIVICELVWVLSGAYGYNHSTILAVLKQVLVTRTFVVEDSDVVWAAVYEYESGPADLAAYLIGLINKRAGSRYTATFDVKAGTHRLFKLLK